MLYDNSNPYAGKKDPYSRCACYWYNMLWSKAISLFKWEGKLFDGTDATLNNDFLEWCLLTQGQAAFIKDKNGKLRGLQTTRVGFDCYMQPVSLLCVNPVLGELEGINGINAVWIKNNKLAQPIFNVIRYYAEKLAALQTSVQCNLDNIKLSKIFIADSDPQAQQIRLLVDKVTRGEPAVILKKGLKDAILGGESNQIPVYSAPNEYIANELLETMHDIVNEFYSTFGVNCSGASQKRERNLMAEVDSNNQQIIINRDYWLESRKQAAEVASNIFGTEITVSLREEEIDYELQQPESGYEQDGNISES